MPTPAAAGISVIDSSCVNVHRSASGPAFPWSNAFPVAALFPAPAPDAIPALAPAATAPQHFRDRRFLATGSPTCKDFHRCRPREDSLEDSGWHQVEQCRARDRPGFGPTKLDLVRYYESVPERTLPHLRHRPCPLVRGPTGVTGELFPQKHDEKISIPGIKELDPTQWPGHVPLLEGGTAQALAAAAQMNVIEFLIRPLTTSKSQTASSSTSIPARHALAARPGERGAGAGAAVETEPGALA